MVQLSHFLHENVIIAVALTAIVRAEGGPDDDYKNE